ncbi:MAG: hypothetical protein JWR51_3860 [Devosia sp.]|uniref:hypothetical protein n=1 Tax=Devosia sp. TaxID=1871048 RepID=UPI002614B9AC|nr:hypothetical protein [Devosia sp.]MDB5530757.1 hypothetical protein [Devosia sp.]
MCGASAVDDDWGLVSLRQGKAGVRQGSTESVGGGGRPGGSKHGAQIDRRNFRALLNVPAARRKRRNLDGAVQVVAFTHPGSDGLVAVLEQGPVDGHRSGDWRRRESKLARGENGALFSAPVRVAQVDNAAVGPYKTIEDMCVGAASFGVQNTAAVLILESEFAFQVSQEDADDLGSVVTDGRVNVQVPNGAGSATVGGTCHELAQLPCQVIGR